MQHAQSPPVKSPDPFELERLAEELAERDALHPLDLDSSDVPDLPDFIPLSHNDPFLTTTSFNVDDFLLSRSYTSLPDLRSELKDYLSSLKEELVQLINDDYEAFISLSTDLRGEGKRLEKMKVPLSVLKTQAQLAREGLQVVQTAIQQKLDARSKIREEKAYLHMLIKISESVTKLESLLHVAPPPGQSPGGEGSGRLFPSQWPGESPSETPDLAARGNRAKHLSRAAAEYSQLTYHVSKAKDDDCAFINEIQWRVDRIQSTLSSDLDHVFSAAVTVMATSKDTKTSEIERTKAFADVSECLRIYDNLGLWRNSENILRRDLMQDFLRKTVYSGALSVPRSPLMPHTPALAVPQLVESGNNFLRTPYTPYTAFASKKNPFEAQMSSGPATAYLLDDSDDSLAAFYNQILRFVERDMTRIMETADRVSLKSTAASKLKDKNGAAAMAAVFASPKKERGYVEGFEIMSNVVWAEVGQKVMDELGNVVFAAGNPDEFRKRYETTQAFIRSLEFLAPSTHAVESMRVHPVYATFERRWQLPIYFQLRWKEIVPKVEDALAPFTNSGLKHERGQFITTQSNAVWTAITSCWSAQIYIPELGFRFWRLTLQLLSRYKTWVKKNAPGLEDVPRKGKSGPGSDKLSSTQSPTSRSSTPVIGDNSTPESTEADNQTIKQSAALMSDILKLADLSRTLWTQEISIMLPDFHEDVGLPEDALRQQLADLEAFVPLLSDQVVQILSRRCCDALLPVRSIPSQFRAMSNKRPPAEPSYFVHTILRPLKDFFAGSGERLKEAHMRAYATEIFDNVCQRYIYYLSAMKKTEESLRRLKRGKKQTTALSFFGGGQQDNGRDEERIRQQMILDVEAFAKDGEGLGVDTQALDSFKMLLDMVQASLLEDA
ncbi:COG complex component [Coniophora puteana RWD-64-598 SS2]|uniref:Conserved oligomeric Golgi complex subunit 2 n=1 Tax=Coniophora puteana (strain RWD-64-598) TaxID=741705 RepID=A0A5M3MW92_CONPW|nr:COG complex component [Coniophora puteana RWD-64-598 SS2]EIW83330.1 COG complex component [Coniophora puteana RWD-64-598 SS2]